MLRSAGGAGYGDPLERDPILVLHDVSEEYVSLEKATEDYGVLINPQTLELDREATSRLRDSMRHKQEKSHGASIADSKAGVLVEEGSLD